MELVCVLVGVTVAVCDFAGVGVRVPETAAEAVGEPVLVAVGVAVGEALGGGRQKQLLPAHRVVLTGCKSGEHLDVSTGKPVALTHVTVRDMLP